MFPVVVSSIQVHQADQPPEVFVVAVTPEVSTPVTRRNDSSTVFAVSSGET